MANEVSMKGVMQTTITADMKLEIHNYLANNIKSSIDNAASQSGAGGIGNSVLSGVNGEIDNIQNIVENYLQSADNNIHGSQTINIKNAPVSFVTQDAFMTSFSSFIASNTSYTTSVNKIASAIKNSTDQNLGSGSIITIIVVIIIILIIGAIIYWLWNKKSSENVSDLAPKLAPKLASFKFRNHA
jgi:hypothetical protein